MPYLKKISHLLLILIVLIAFNACGPSSKRVSRNSITADTSELKLDRSQLPTRVYKRPGAPTLAAYKRFIIDPVQVNYRDPKMRELSPEDIERMQRYFRKSLIKELRDGGYRIGTRSEAKTLKISLIISGLKAPTALPNISAALAPIAINVGEVTVEAVFREALTNRIDAVAVATSQGSRVLNPTPWSTWADVEKAFDQWAEGIRGAVDKAHGR
jgi:hypothetical protein